MAHSQDEPAWQKTLRDKSKSMFNDVSRADTKDRGVQTERSRIRQSDPRDKDGPKVAEMRTELRDIEKRLQAQPTMALKPEGVRADRAGQQALMKREMELLSELHQVDKARENFNERASPSKTRDHFNDRAQRDR